MASKLSIYSGALRALGERRLSSLTEDRASRRELDDAYDDVIANCLEAGYWNFAMRTVELEPSTDAEPQFGFNYAYEKPEDWVRTYRIAASERFDPPLKDFDDEGAYWFADVDPLYVRYVSNDADATNPTAWPRSFVAFVELSLAKAICLNITGSGTSKEEIVRELKKAKADAVAKDAMNQSSESPPAGTWVTSRDGGIIRRSRWNGRFS